MKVVYIGPHIDGVLIPYGLGEISAPHGQPVEVPDDLGRGLLDQPSNWALHTERAKKPTTHEEGD